MAPRHESRLPGKGGPPRDPGTPASNSIRRDNQITESTFVAARIESTSLARSDSSPSANEAVDDNNHGDDGNDDIVEIDRAEFFADSKRDTAEQGPQGTDDAVTNDLSELLTETVSGTDFADFYPQPASDEDRKRFSNLACQIETAVDLAQLYPASLHGNYRGPSSSANVVDEQTALEYLGQRLRNTDIQPLELHDFEIYDRIQLNGKGFGGQFRSPVDILTKALGLVIDGTIRKGDEQLHVNGMDIVKMEISNLLDPSTSSVRSHIMIQTSGGETGNVWYRLATPTQKYKKIWDDFVWILDFSKLAITFLLASAEEQRQVSLKSFEQDFHDFVTSYNGIELNVNSLGTWLMTSGHATDFRKHIIRYASILNATAGILISQGYAELSDHKLWKDIDTKVEATTIGNGQRKARGSTPSFEQTVVTPDVGNAFLRCFPHWGPDPGKRDLFEMVSPNETVRRAILARRKRLDFPDKYQNHEDHFMPVNKGLKSRAALTLERVATERKHNAYRLGEVIGQVIVLERASVPLQRFQYALVRDTTINQKILVAWLVLPSSTTCGEGFYPIGNELMLSDECSCVSVDLSKVRGVFPADLCGSGASETDGFFIHSLYLTDTQKHITANHQIHIVPGCIRHKCPPEQGVSPLPDAPKCSKIGLYSLFSECGLLDHSMSSTGYFETKLAVDLNKAALLSHKANTRNDEECRHVLRSTNAYLKDVLNAQEEYHNVDCLVAGCPCTGFSALNGNKASLEAHRNCSMLANLLSHIAVFLPQYGMIENVALMNHKNKDVGAGNACEVAISVLVLLGYQVTKTIVGGVQMNSATRRERPFICYAAPGLKLPEPPIAFRDETNAYEAIQDLDPVHNDCVHNVKQPDQVPFERLNVNFDAGIAMRNVVSRIPKDGKRRDLYAAAVERRLLSRKQMQWFGTLTAEKQSKRSTSLRRVPAEGQFSTITSTIVPMNSRGMCSIHPFQDRVLTLAELRRGQELPEGFLLVGDMREAAKQIGNGVAWEVGEGWGLSFARAAWESGLVEEVGGDEDMGGE